jgi:predicted dipeptidase
MLALPSLLAAALLAPGPQGLAAAYRAREAARLAPLLSEVLRFPTVAGNRQAFADQKAWLLRIGRELGLAVRDAGKVVEVELAGPPGAPVLGLMVHGDVQPVDDHWSFPPFGGAVRDGEVLGRGAADDKGPLVQALLALRTLAEAGPRRTHAIRLLVGSDEESDNTDVAEYLAGHAPPDLTLVLDSAFPVVVGEKAWVGYWIETGLASRKPASLEVLSVDAGLAPSIVPDRATLTLRAAPGADLAGLRARLEARKLPPGTHLELRPGEAGTLVVVAHGRAAHGGVNLEGGRNALVALARAMDGELPPGGADDLLHWARVAGEDLYGSSLDLPRHPVFGPISVNPAMLKAQGGGAYRLFVNLRATPELDGEALRAHLDARVKAYADRTGARLATGGYFEDRPLAFDPGAKVVKRLLASYARATGRADPPAISGGGTYAKRLPRAIPFGMWFPGKPYPGHDVDERMALEDLHRGVEVLLAALADLACSPPLSDPFRP